MKQKNFALRALIFVSVRFEGEWNYKHDSAHSKPLIDSVSPFRWNQRQCTRTASFKNQPRQAQTTKRTNLTHTIEYFASAIITYAWLGHNNIHASQSNIHLRTLITLELSRIFLDPYDLMKCLNHTINDKENAKWLMVRSFSFFRGFNKTVAGILGESGA